MQRPLLAAAAMLAAAGVSIALILPPARLELPVQDDGTVPGVLHIHTNRSDGHGSPEDVARAAARAGIKFVVLTDHGDAMRTPDPPTYRDGVLCLDGVEISTNDGHYVVVGLGAAPYPLRGEARDVVQDVARLGGFGIAAHPDSPKRDLQWDAWAEPFDGLEIINPDTGWRAHATGGGIRSKLRLFEALVSYPFRPPEAISSVLSDASSLLKHWGQLTRTRRVVAVAGTDAHAQIGRVALPRYEQSFRMLSVHVRPAHPLSGDASADAAAIVSGLRAGHVYTTVDGFATRSAFRFTASSALGTAEQGDELPANGAISLHVSSNAPPTYRTTVWRDDQILDTRAEGSSFSVPAPPGPAVYRVEIRAHAGTTLPPWLVSNPIYVRAAATESLNHSATRPAGESLPLIGGARSAGWRVEYDPPSLGSLDRAVGQNSAREEIHLHYQLAEDSSRGSSVGLLAICQDYVTPFDRVTFTARADRPMRVSVQLRTSLPGGVYERWLRSVYVDGDARTHTVRFDDLRPLDVVPGRQRPPLDEMSHLLFVVDTTNTSHGATGDVWISNVMLER